MNYNLVGACGIYCGACDHYLAFQPGHEHLLETEKFKGKNLEDMKCMGCHSDELTPHCKKCDIRNCARTKDLKSCKNCYDYLCSRVKIFYEDGKKYTGAKHRLHIIDNNEAVKLLGINAWLVQQQKRWTCKCGMRFSFYETTCIKCNRPLNSYAKEIV